MTGELTPSIKRYRDEYRRLENAVQMLTTTKTNIDNIKTEATTNLTGLKTLLGI
jgi:hypothetical protein